MAMTESAELALRDAWNKATPGRASAFYPIGEFDCEILEVKLVQGYDGTASFIIRSRVDSSNEPSVAVGSERQTVYKFNKKPAIANAKQFVATCLGKRFEDAPDKDMAYAVSPKQPFVGYKMHVSGVLNPIPSNPNFVKLHWSVLSTK